MRTIKIRGMILGEGREKIVSSIMDPKMEDLMKTLDLVKGSHLDCIEYRGDWSEDVHNHVKMQENLRRIRDYMGDFPILFTFRSVGEGGHLDIPVEEYVELNRRLIDTGCLDMVDVESWIGDELVRGLCEYSHARDVKVVCSYHNFKETPSVEWMTELMRHMRDLGADIPKCAVMAKDRKDLLRLLTATEAATDREEDGPVLTMAMGKEGMFSRLCGEMFGSCLTFSSLKASSAPGQVPVEETYELMERLHRNCTMGY